MIATNLFPKDFSSNSRARMNSNRFSMNFLNKEMLKAEMEAYPGYEKYSRKGYGCGSSRNGYYPKRVNSESPGDMALNIFRDCNPEFEPRFTDLPSIYTAINI